MRRLWLTGLWGLIAAVAFVAQSGLVQHATPYVVMALAERKVLNGAPPNRILHGAVPDATARKVVRPSPDMAYSLCVYDLTEGPVRLTAYFPPDNYWSAAAYGANTDNFWVLNDLQAGGSPIVAILGTKRQLADLSPQAGVISVAAPSKRGVILLRHLVSRPDILPMIETARRQDLCEAMRE